MCHSSAASMYARAVESFQRSEHSPHPRQGQPSHLRLAVVHPIREQQIGAGDDDARNELDAFAVASVLVRLDAKFSGCCDGPKGGVRLDRVEEVRVFIAPHERLVCAIQRWSAHVQRLRFGRHLSHPSQQPTTSFASLRSGNANALHLEVEPSFAAVCVTHADVRSARARGGLPRHLQQVGGGRQPVAADGFPAEGRWRMVCEKLQLGAELLVLHIVDLDYSVEWSGAAHARARGLCARAGLHPPATSGAQKWLALKVGGSERADHAQPRLYHQLQGTVAPARRDKESLIPTLRPVCLRREPFALPCAKMMQAAI
mmetsp:Transcript_38522/g.112756  ORF Transcript_38522/g.112756 Transcript_38522/m.112756 type:complete len:315 (+) Transcript_38522:277-1221(+)